MYEVMHEIFDTTKSVYQDGSKVATIRVILKAEDYNLLKNLYDQKLHEHMRDSDEKLGADAASRILTELLKTEIQVSNLRG